MSLLVVQDVAKIEQGKYILRPIRFALAPQQKLAIAGETGSGKTTLLKLMAGLLQPDAGAVFFNGQRLLGPWEQLLPGHPAIAYLSQHFELRNNYKVHELLEMSNYLSEEAAQTIYAVCRIEPLLQRRTDELSGGERQRIALAQLLTKSPSLLFLDEPFSNLDRVHRSMMQAVIDDISAELGITCVLVSHDALELMSWADQLMVLRHGALVQAGSPRDLYYHPVNEYVAGLLGDYNLIDTAQHPGFVQLLGPASAGKKALLRPEHLALTTEGPQSLPGVVEQVLFHGSHYQLRIWTDGYLVKLNTALTRFVPGETVHVGLQHV
jgi:ABC-type sugar transport system ATPase subunit